MRFRRKSKDGDGSKDEKKPEETAPSISYFTLFRFSTGCDKLLIAIAVLASMIAGLILPYAITLVANIFQAMITFEMSRQEGKNDDAGFLKRMHSFGIHYSGIGVVLFICAYLGNALTNLTAINQIFRLRQEYLKAALNQDFSYFDLYQTTDFASKMSADVIKLEEGIGDKVSAFVYSVTTAIGCLVMAISKGWKLALLCLTTTPITFLLVGLTGRIADRLYKKEAVQTGRASAIAQEVLSSIRTVYAYNGQQKELERYNDRLAEAKRIYIKKEFFTGLSMGLMFFFVFSSYALSFYFGIYLVIVDPEHYNADVMFSTLSMASDTMGYLVAEAPAGFPDTHILMTLSVELLSSLAYQLYLSPMVWYATMIRDLTVFFGVMTGLGNLGLVGSLVQSFGVARGAGAQIFRLLDNVPTINPLLDRGFKPHEAQGVIELKNVEFNYPSRPNVPVLKGVTLSVKLGHSVALVGHSGCGKSTIIQLISRYYDTCKGSVCVDGYDVRDLSVVWLRSQIGLVGQEPVLFNTTVKENIRYGRQDATDEDIVAAAMQANAHHFIVKLPRGYETLVGERGASLSGGQKQRIAIARALVRRPRLLLLDEATSALDTASEAKVQLALDKAAQGRTTVVVAHRLSTIRRANLIYVMKNGELVESGTHEELMEKRGHYHDMVALQEPLAVSWEDNVVSREESLLSEIDSDTAISMGMPYDVNQPSSEMVHMSFWRMLALKSQDWKWMTTGMICSVIIGFAMPLFIVIFGDLFDSMSDPDTNKLMQKVYKLSLFCVIIGLVMGTSHLFEAISFGVSGAHLTERLRSRMFAHLLRQSVTFFDDKANSTGALSAKLSAEASYVQGATGQRVGVCLQGVGSVGIAFVLAVLYEWRVGLVALSFLPLVVIVIHYQSKATNKESFGNAKALENSTKIALEAVCNVRTVVSLGLERWLTREYVRALSPALAAARHNAHCRGLVAGLSRSMFNFINAAALTYGGHLIVSQGVKYANILVTTQSLQIASGQVQNAFMLAPEFQKGVSAASRIMAVLNTKPTICDPNIPLVSPFVPKGEAYLKDVDFTYPTRAGVQVLRGMDLQLENGKTIALVGRSGCGKSTVIQLLQRFYDPDAGKVCLDDTPLTGIRLSEARSAFGLVSQEPVLFDYSIEENIAYGDYTRSPSHHEIVDAAKQANIHDFIVSLPTGYETNIGPKGLQLSGGQKQRVAIARALIRRPKILLLDEATSALDTESEKVVQAALDAASASRTCLTIAHRLSTVRHAHLVCVVSRGTVAEAGTHTQLLDRKGLYYHLHSKS